jgi:hypothetical protein
MRSGRVLLLPNDRDGTGMDVHTINDVDCVPRVILEVARCG